MVGGGGNIAPKRFYPRLYLVGVTLHVVPSTIVLRGSQKNTDYSLRAGSAAGGAVKYTNNDSNLVWLIFNCIQLSQKLGTRETNLIP